MSFLLGLTGSIGMGKSTTAKMFADLGCDLWDADAAVHRLYSAGGAAVGPIGQKFPEAIKDAAVSRDALRRIIAADTQALSDIERIVHPLVAEDRAIFAKNSKAQIVVFDIPLLFEKGTQTELDATVCVSIPAEIQRDRVLARGTMTAQDFETIVSRQMPNQEKCALADYVIVTDSLEHARQQVQFVVQDIKRKLNHA